MSAAASLHSPVGRTRPEPSKVAAQTYAGDLRAWQQRHVALGLDLDSDALRGSIEVAFDFNSHASQIGEGDVGTPGFAGLRDKPRADLDSIGHRW